MERTFSLNPSFKSIWLGFSSARLIMRKLVVFNMPRITLLALFAVALLELNCIGFVYFVAMLLFTPFSASAGRIWLLLVLYSQFASLVIYVYQFPFFVETLKCPATTALGMIHGSFFTQGSSNRGSASSPPTGHCEWLAWAGLDRYDFGTWGNAWTANTFLLLYPHMIILAISLIQKRALRWKQELYSMGVVSIKIDRKYQREIKH